MKYKYIGYGEDPPEEIIFFGFKFLLNGDSVEVGDLERIKGHRCFELQGQEKSIQKQYEDKFGEKPHHLMKEKTIKARLDAKS